MAKSHSTFNPYLQADIAIAKQKVKAKNDEQFLTKKQQSDLDGGIEFVVERVSRAYLDDQYKKDKMMGADLCIWDHPSGRTR